MIGFGLGLRADHYDHVLEQVPASVDWFEIISENFMESHKGYWKFLDTIRRDYPIIMHGVSLSIGSSDPLNKTYLDKLKALADFLDPPWISDHVCWTGVHGKNTHDLLPVMYNEASLAHMVERIGKVQDHMQRRLLLENPSTYLEFSESTIPEWEFLSQMAIQADCGLLLDVNNIYVNSFNHGYDAKAYIDHLPSDRIVQIHLAGHTDCGTHIIDTHDHPVTDEVWALYAYALKRHGMISTMIEWDDHIPTFDVLEAELDTVRHHAAMALEKAA
jgi:uncharacterized protein